MRWHAIDLWRSVKRILRYSIAWYPHLGEKDKISADESTVLQDLLGVLRFKKRRKRNKDIASLSLQKRTAYRVAIAIKERNADETTPALIVWYACRLLNDPIERVTSVEVWKYHLMSHAMRGRLRNFSTGKHKVLHCWLFIIKEIN